MKKNLITVGLVAAGVVAAGFLMNQLNDVEIIAKAQNGFQGVV